MDGHAEQGDPLGRSLIDGRKVLRELAQADDNWRMGLTSCLVQADDMLHGHEDLVTTDGEHGCSH
jgi:hypothetical protein